MRLHASLSAALKSSAALAATLFTASCTDGPLSPDELDAAQVGEITSMLSEVLLKLDGIEQRIDSLEATMTGAGGAGLVLTGLPAAQLDSVLVLASYLAEETIGGSWEACGNIDLAGEFGMEWIGEAEGVGAGHLGAWAGTGAYAGGNVSGKFAVGGGFKLEGSGGVEFCYPLGAGSPPVRPLPAGPMRASPELDQIRTTLTSLTSQFNLTPATLTASLGGVSDAIASPGSLGLQTLGANLPLPSGLASLAANPLGTVSGQVEGLLTSAQSALCTAGLGGGLSTVITQACGIINAGGISNFAVMADVANTFPAVATAVSNVCNRVNTFGVRRLIIPSWDVTFPLGIGTVNVFPGYNQLLFPSYTSVPCP